MVTSPGTARSLLTRPGARPPRPWPSLIVYTILVVLSTRHVVTEGPEPGVPPGHRLPTLFRHLADIRANNLRKHRALAIALNELCGKLKAPQADERPPGCEGSPEFVPNQ